MSEDNPADQITAEDHAASSDKNKWIRRGAAAAVGVLSAVGLGHAANIDSSPASNTPNHNQPPAAMSAEPAKTVELVPAQEITSTTSAPATELAPNSASSTLTRETTKSTTVGGGQADAEPTPIAVDPTIATGNAPDTTHGENGGMPTEMPVDTGAVDPGIAHGNAPDTTHGENGGMPTSIPGQP